MPTTVNSLTKNQPVAVSLNDRHAGAAATQQFLRVAQHRLSARIIGGPPITHIVRVAPPPGPILLALAQAPDHHPKHNQRRQREHQVFYHCLTRTPGLSWPIFTGGTKPGDRGLSCHPMRGSSSSIKGRSYGRIALPASFHFRDHQPSTTDRIAREGTDRGGRPRREGGSPPAKPNPQPTLSVAIRQ